MNPESSFTDQKHRIATEQHVSAKWGSDGKAFYCGLCGHRFVVGDGWRWVYANGSSPSTGNFFTCDSCDRPDAVTIRQKALSLWREAQNDEFVLGARLARLHALLEDRAKLEKEIDRALTDLMCVELLDQAEIATAVADRLIAYLKGKE